MRGQYKDQSIVATDWPPRVGRDFFGRLALVEKQNSKVKKQNSKLEKQNSKVEKQSFITGRDSAWYELKRQFDAIVKMTGHEDISVEDIQQNSIRGKSVWYQLRGKVDKIVKMAEHKSVEDIQQNSIRGKDSVQISVEDILKPKDSSQSLRVVIDGPPGIGKTTLCRKLLNMWSIGTLHQQYDLVLYCPLRNSKIATATTLTDLFVYKSPKVPEVVKWFSNREGGGLLIIFDGWDELSTEHRQSSLVASIICRKQLDHCAVIVTSRSFASSSLLEMDTVSSHVQVIGFSEDEISTVIIQTLQEDPKLAQELIATHVNVESGSDADGKYYMAVEKLDKIPKVDKDTQPAVKLINDLKVRDDVRSLCYIPLVCSMVILVYHKEKQLPTTLTQLYENFILQTIRRHVKRHDTDDPYALGSLSSLPSQLVKPFQEICQIAYTNLTNKRITFSSHELHQLSLSQAVKEDYLGLITAFTEYDEKKYQFLHLSIQEFLAAWWIAKHEEKTEEVFQTHFDNDHFKMCLRFVAGLTHLEHENYQQYFNKQQLDLQCKREPLFGFNVHCVSWFHLNPGVTTKHEQYQLSAADDDDDFDKFLFLLQLLYESQNTTLCQVLAQSTNNRSLCLQKRVYSLSLFHWLCLSYFINNSNTTWKEIDLDVPYLNGKQMLSVFTTGLANSSEQTQCKRLILDVNESRSGSAITQFLQLSLLHNIQECYCELRKIQCVSGLVLLQFLNLPKIKVLHLIIDDPTTDIPIVGGTHYSDMCKELQESIEQNSTIQEMKIVYEREKSLITDIVTFILRGVTGNKTLTSLSLTAEANFFFEDVPPPTIPNGVIEQLLKDNKTLQVLSLDIPDELLSPSLNIVEVNTPLTALEIAGGKRSTSEMMTSLLTPYISGLKCLVLHNKYLPPYSIFLLYPSLQALRLQIDTYEAIELFTVLQTNTTLKALKAKISVEDTVDTVIALLGIVLQNMLARNKTLICLEIHTGLRNHYQYFRRKDIKLYKTSILTTLLYLTARGIEHNSTLQQLRICIPMPNAEAMKGLFGIISQKKNLTQLKVTFNLDEPHWEISDGKEESSYEEQKSNYKKRRERMTVLFYKEVLPAVTNMLQSHTTIRLLKIKLEYRLSDREPHQNENETMQHFFKTIFVHQTLEYIKIGRGFSSPLGKMLKDQKKSLIDKHKQEQPHKPLPIIDV